MPNAPFECPTPLFIYIHPESKSNKVTMRYGQGIGYAFNGGLPESEGCLKHPVYVATHSDSKYILVSDFGSKSVKVYDTAEREFIRAIRRPDDVPMARLDPRGVCEGFTREVLVCDYKNNQILEFNILGKFISAHTHANLACASFPILKPIAIAIHKEKRLLAVAHSTSDNQGCVSIFSPAPDRA